MENNNNENKNFKILVWLVVVLSILVVVLMGVIVYKEFYSENKTSVDNTNKSTTKARETIKTIGDFPQKSDNSIKSSFYLKNLLYDGSGKALINDKEDFENISARTSDNMKYIMSCDEYYESEAVCESIEIEFDDYDTDLYFYNSDGCSDETFVIITDKYLIEQRINGCGAGGKVTVFDKNGKRVFTEDNSVYKYSNDVNSEDENEVKIAVFENMLYYVSYTEDSLEDNKLYFNSLDLSNMNKNQIQTFDGTSWGLE